MSFRQSLSIVDSSNFQPQEPSPTSKLTSVFSRQRLDPIPLLKQKLPHVNNSDFLSTKEATISSRKVTASQSDFVIPKSGEKNFESPRGLSQSRSQPIKDLFKNSFNSVRNYGRLCDQPFLEYSQCHKMQILGLDKKAAMPKRLPPIKHRKQQELINLLSPTGKSAHYTIKIEDNYAVDEDRGRKNEQKVYNDEQVESPAEDEYLPNDPELMNLPPTIKKVHTIQTYGVILLFHSMEITLVNVNSDATQDSNKRGKRNRVAKETIKINAAQMYNLVGLTNDSIYAICKDCLNVNEQGKFSLSLRKDIVAEHGVKLGDLEQGLNFEQTDEIKLNNVSYKYSISGATLELYIPESGQSEKLELNHGQLEEIIINKMENIPDYVQYFVLPKTLVERKDISKEQNDQPIDDSKSINVQQQDAQNIAADESIYSHEHYTCVKDDQKADAIAWAFSNKDEFVRIPFRFEKLGDDELRVNITYTGLCHSDVMTGRSHWGPAKYPITPGHEVVGIVAQVGKNVKNFNVGERIAYGPARDSCDSCRNCQKGYDNICNVVEAGKKGLYGEYWGGYATAIQQPAKWAFKLPESLPSDRTPPILCAGVTVYAPLARYVKHGSKVGIIGIGGLGHMAVQYARKMGCHVTALSSTKGKEDLLKNELGAHEVISSIDPEELKKAAQRFDVIINTLTVANNEIFGLYLQLVAPNGTFVQVGAPPIEEGLNIKAFQLIMNNINFAGSLVGSRRETKACLNFSALHNILPMCEFFGFEDFPKALDTLENGRPKFRCVVKVEEWSKKNGFFKN